MVLIVALLLSLLLLVSWMLSRGVYPEWTNAMVHHGHTLMGVYLKCLVHQALILKTWL